MKILFVGEIVASPGRQAVKDLLPALVSETGADVVFSNAENLAGGRGITQETIQEMQKAGIDYFTGGDHSFWQKDSEDLFETLPVLRPANYPSPDTPGKGYAIVDCGAKGNVLLINLMGRTGLSSTFSYLDDPFKKLDEILEETSGQNFAATVVDFHAEITSEKYAFGFYVDGRVDGVIGTHTHVPTADNRVLPEGTLFVADVGMTGNIDSVLGINKEIILNLFATARNQRFEWEKAGTKAFRSVLLDTDDKSIQRIDKIIR